MSKRDLVDWLAYVGLRIVVCGIQSLPLERCDRLCCLGAKVLSDWIPFRKNVIDENLRAVLGPKSADQCASMRRLMWRSLLLMVCEIAHAPRKIHRTNWRNHFYLRDKEKVFRLMMDERATVVVSGHFGNFEMAGFVTGLFGFPCTTIARPLDNRFVNSYVAEFRSLGGQHILDKSGASTAVQDLLNRGGTVALLADQHAGDKGCWASFLGRPASCHKGLALFVLSSKAPMIVAYNRRLDRPMRFELGSTGVADPRIEGPHLASVQALTQWYNARLEEAIRRSPAQYWWVHRRWRDPPAKKRRTSDIPSLE